MSQHDYVIDNNSGRNVRLDINDVLSAIVSDNSGDTEPAVTFPFMRWMDTSADPIFKLKMRNDDDSAWIVLFTISSGVLVSSSYNGYAAVVGSDPSFCTHATLQAALADSAVLAGSKILVTANQTVNSGSPISISKANIQVDFLPGITFTNGTAGTGITIAASGCRIKGGRFSGFTTAISISATFQYNFVTDCRFVSCSAEVVEADSAPVNVIANNITE